MAINILMPALSPTMTEGKLAKWHVKEGDKVTSGQVICEIETDNATMEVEAVDEGVVGRILVAEGTEAVKVNAPIAILVEEGEAVPAAPAPVAASAPQPAPTPAAKPAAPSSPSPLVGEGRGGGPLTQAPATGAPPSPTLPHKGGGRKTPQPSPTRGEGA